MALPPALDVSYLADNLSYVNHLCSRFDCITVHR